MSSVRSVQIPEHWGRHLRSLRQRANLSLRDLAEAAQIAAATIHRWESSELPTGHIEHLLRIQTALGLGSIEELLGPVRMEYPSAKQGRALMAADQSASA